MSNYKQSAVTGESWVRAVRVVLENPLGGGAAATFIEETVVSTPAGNIMQAAGNVVEPFTVDNAAEAFDVLNPETGEVVGSATYQDVYALLHSLYYHVAAKRDAAVGG